MFGGFILPLLLTLVGSVFFVRLCGFFLFHPLRSTRVLVKEAGGGRSAAKTLALALAGTLGVGNISGIALGILLGGAGSVFWLLLSSVFASTVKYAEEVLTIDDKRRRNAEKGGMMFVVRSTFLHTGRPLSRFYAFLCLLVSFTMGSALQTKTVAETETRLSDLLLGVLFALLVLAAVLRGGQGIERVTFVLIPLTTTLYIGMTLAVILPRLPAFPALLREILSSAFSPRAGGGGIAGALTNAALREGFARGILSNEAGAGTSTLAHARNAASSPVGEGLLGIAEVFFDTVVLCPLTAFAVLLGVKDPSAYATAGDLLDAAFLPTLGPVYRFLMLFCVFSFAYATVICWYYYGSECVSFLFGERAVRFYLPLYLLATAAGAVLPMLGIVSVIDVFLFLLSCVTLTTLLKNADRVVSLSAAVLPPRKNSTSAA